MDINLFPKIYICLCILIQKLVQNKLHTLYDVCANSNQYPNTIQIHIRIQLFTSV